MTRAEKIVIGVAILAVMAIACLAVLDYSGYGAQWMGFSESSKVRETTTFDSSNRDITSVARTEDIRWTKTIWDWMQILVIPAAVAIGTFVLNQTAKRRDEAMEGAQKAREEALADQRAQDAALQSYLDQMSNLLMDSNFLNKIHELHDVLGDRFRVVSRARTLATLGQLGGTRKGSVVRFLYEAELIKKSLPGVSLALADIREANLSSANLRGARLAQVDLRGANLSEADLSEAILSGAKLEGAILSRTNLVGTNLTSSTGITQEQINLAVGDATTQLPGGNLDRPDTWN